MDIRRRSGRGAAGGTELEDIDARLTRLQAARDEAETAHARDSALLLELSERRHGHLTDVDFDAAGALDQEIADATRRVETSATTREQLGEAITALTVERNQLFRQDAESRARERYDADLAAMADAITELGDAVDALAVLYARAKRLEGEQIASTNALNAVSDPASTRLEPSPLLYRLRNRDGHIRAVLEAAEGLHVADPTTAAIRAGV